MTTIKATVERINDDTGESEVVGTVTISEKGTDGDLIGSMVGEARYAEKISQSVTLCGYGNSDYSPFELVMEVIRTFEEELEDPWCADEDGES